jgi:hypothetical protein
MWAKSKNRIFMAGEVGENCHLAQGEEKPGFQLESLIRHAQECSTLLP